MGNPPFRIEILTSVSGVVFDEEFKHRVEEQWGDVMISASRVANRGLFFVLEPNATGRSGTNYLAYVGFFVLIAGLVVVGVALIRRPRSRNSAGSLPTNIETLQTERADSW